MKAFLILLMISVMVISGCRQDKKQDNSQLTTSDIATVLQMKWWCLKVPAGMETKCLGIGIKNGSEKIKSFGGMSGLKEGIYKVIVWGWDKENLSYSIITNNGSVIGGALNPKLAEQDHGVVSTAVPDGQIIKPDETFYVKSAKNSVSLAEPITTDKIGYCFTFENHVVPLAK